MKIMLLIQILSQIIIIIFFYPAKHMQEGKNHHQKEVKEQPFKLFKTDFEDLYLRTAVLPKSLKKDLEEWSRINRFRYYLYNKTQAWLLQQKDERLRKSAEKAHKIVDNLLIQEVPFMCLQIYLTILKRNHEFIQKQIDHIGGQEIYKYVPNVLVIDFLEVFNIKLTKKEKEELISQLVSYQKTCHERLSKLVSIFKDKQYYADFLINKLIKSRKENIAAKVLKKLGISQLKYPRLQESLIEFSARGMPHWQKEKFTWDILEEVYELYPSAIAACIKKLMEKQYKKYRQGFASIIIRNPKVVGYLPGKLEKELKEIKKILPNRLRTDRFEPSDKAKYFTLKEFGIDEKDVIWVNSKNVNEAVEELFSADLIGIDTESTVARTTLNSSYELLATIQIATLQKIFIFDAKQLKNHKVHHEIIDKFFQNDKNTIIGHTLDADLNGDVTSIFGFKGKIMCQTHDIFPLFKKIHPGKRAGLTYITQEILGKPICKEYTLTNWDRRPLLKNQIHYAAMDALIVLKIWLVLKQVKIIDPIKPHHENKNHENKKHEENKRPELSPQK